MTAGPFEAVVGLEVHAQLATRTKLFCGCSAAYGAPPNTHVCPVCLGLPGALPVPNRAAIDMAITVGLALGCDVRPRSVFARKNYFYPDLPKGYQISQYELPIDAGGELDFAVDGETRRVRLERIHLEEDAAKTQRGEDGATLVDFNRGGVPLMEIVSRPDLRSGREAEAYLRRLREVLLHLGVNDGNLEEGSFRCDANVSIRPAGAQALGTRVELKNLNSFRFVRLAIEHEVERQAALVSGGGSVAQETRAWDEAGGRTVPLRGKEEAMDYRYFPDPDLPPVVVDAARIERCRAAMRELPDARRARWRDTLGVRDADATVLSGHPAVADWFDGLVAALPPGVDVRSAVNFTTAEVLRDATTGGLEARLPASPGRVAELLGLVADGTLTGKLAKQVWGDMVATRRPAPAVVDALGLRPIDDAAAVEAEARAVVAAHPAQADAYRAGKTKMLGFFVGQVMKATGGRARPEMVHGALARLLSGAGADELPGAGATPGAPPRDGKGTT